MPRDEQVAQKDQGLALADPLPTPAPKDFAFDDVARLSSAVLKPRPEAGSKHLWLSELGASVAARVRDCLHCGSGSAVRALLTQTDTELDIHVRVLRVKAGPKRQSSF